MTGAPRQAAEQPIVLGRIVGLFGVKGWVKVYSYTEPREAVLEYERCLLRKDEVWESAGIVEGKRHGKSVIARFEGIDDRDAAAELVGLELGIERTEMPEPDQGQYYWADLEGLKVLHRDGTELGTVAYVMATGANDVLVTSGERERLIPFVLDEVILDVDLVNGVITVDGQWD